MEETPRQYRRDQEVQWKKSGGPPDTICCSSNCIGNTKYFLVLLYLSPPLWLRLRSIERYVVVCVDSSLSRPHFHEGPHGPLTHVKPLVNAVLGQRFGSW